MSMNKKIWLYSLFIISVTLVIPFPVFADKLDPCGSGDAGKTAICESSATSLTGGILGNVINILLFLAGTIAVIMIIIGGIRYITSDGDANKAGQAKNTIIYAIIGLVVAVLSYGIVAFVLGRL